jgi:hypothetical protein
MPRLLREANRYILRNNECLLRNRGDNQGQIQRLFDLDNNHEYDYGIKEKSKKRKKGRRNERKP